MPPAWRALFRSERAILATHRGYDAGALDVARGLARLLAAPLVAGATTRLLVDLNRSPHNPTIFSRFTRSLPRAEREALVARLHAPHWARVERVLASAMTASSQRGARPVVHLAVHSFTPVLGDDVRDFELGLLYDPRRPAERRFADRLRESIGRRAPALRIRRNAPYRGTSDGLPTALRHRHPRGRYLGLELELNQAVLGTRRERLAWVALLADALGEVLEGKSTS